MPAMTTTTPPHSREEILDALTRQENDNAAYWNAFDGEGFFARIGESWSPAETVRHLTKAIRPVAKALTLPRFVLRLRFGKARRASQRYDELLARYEGLLAAGGKAGRFAPSERTEADLDAWRGSIMKSFTRVNEELRRAVTRWPEAKLDALQLPHPLLGMLTVREMLFFTLFHQQHHIDVVRKRRAEVA
jgi:hypothetical protein